MREVFGTNSATQKGFFISMPTKSIKSTSNRESSFTHVDNFASAVKQTQALPESFEKLSGSATCFVQLFFFFKDRD